MAKAKTKRREFYIVALCILVYLLSILVVFAAGRFFGEEMVKGEIYSLTYGIPDNETKIVKILNWTKDNVDYTVDKLYFLKYPFMNVRIEDPYWIFLTRFGGCGERALLSKFMIEKLGIEGRVVNNPGENHAWTEVLVNGTWTHADSAAKYNDPGAYERPQSDGGWSKNISYVYWTDENGNRHDVTKTYTDVGLLVVRIVNQNDVPVQGARLIIKSHSLMNPPRNESSPMIAIIDSTNEFGTFKVELGGNDYTVIAEKDVIPLFAFNGIENCTLYEHNICQIEVKLNSTVSLTEDGVKVFLLASVILLFVIILIIPLKILDFIEEKFENKKREKMRLNNVNIWIGAALGAFFISIINISMYFILSNQFKEIMTYWDLYQVLSIFIPSVTAILTISFTVIVLSFNLDKNLPTKIIEKYILNSKTLWLYLSSQTVFIIFSVFAFYRKLNNVYWIYVIFFDLVISVIFSLIFFYWFLERSNKKGIYSIIIKKFSKKINHQKQQNYDLKLSSFNVDLLGSIYSIKKFSSDVSESKEREENGDFDQDIFSKFPQFVRANKSGVIKYRENDLKNVIESNNDLIQKLEIIKSGEFVAENDNICSIQFNTETKVQRNKVLKDIHGMIKIVDEDNEYIRDILDCIIHSERNEKSQLDDDFKVLYEILETASKIRDVEYDTIINTLEKYIQQNRTSENLIKQIILLIYRSSNIRTNNFHFTIKTQNFLVRLFTSYYEFLKDYSKTYATSGLYLSEFIKYNFHTNFENEKDKSSLEMYNQIILNTINVCFEISSYTIRNFFRNEKFNEIYLNEQLQNIIRVLEFYSSDQYHYNMNFDGLRDEEKELIKEKCNIISQAQVYLRKKITDMAFHILYLIQSGKLPISIVKNTFDFIENGDVYQDLDPAPSWMMDDKIHPAGAYFVPQFPRERYILFYLFYQKKNGKNIKSVKWTYDKLHLAEEIKNEAEKMEFDNIETLITMKKGEFNEIKSALVEEFKKAVEACKRHEKEIIINKKIDDDKIKKFRESIIDYWKQNTVVRKLFEIHGNYIERISEKPKTKPDSFLGIYTIFEKSYFIKDPPVPWAGELEHDFGTSLSRSENEHIIRQIIQTKTLPHLNTDLETSFKIIIDKLGTHDSIIFIDSKKEDELSNLKMFTPRYEMQNELKFPETHFACLGFFIYNKIKYPIYALNNVNAVIGIDFKEVGKLVQYDGSDSKKEQIHVSVSKLDKHDEKVLKPDEEPKTKVKIKVVDRFRLEELNQKAFEGYSL